MAEASCSCNSVKSYEDFIDRSEFPLVRFERVLKQPGSRKLVLGQWVTVSPRDPDALSGAHTS